MHAMMDLSVLWNDVLLSLRLKIFPIIRNKNVRAGNPKARANARQMAYTHTCFYICPVTCKPRGAARDELASSADGRGARARQRI